MYDNMNMPWDDEYHWQRDRYQKKENRMSNRPTHRVTAKNADTGEYTEIFVVWPSKREGMPPSLALHRDLSPEDLVKFFSKKPDGKVQYWIDLRENEAQRRDDF